MKITVEDEVITKEASDAPQYQDADTSAHPQMPEDLDADVSAHHEVPEYH